jgi:hypothetical protein
VVSVVTTWQEYLNSSIKVISDLCLEREHAHTRFGKTEPIVCTDCGVLINRLKGMYRDDNPTPPAVLVHFVINPEPGTSPATTLNEVEAIEYARRFKTVVVSMPVSSDWRNTPDEEDGL